MEYSREHLLDVLRTIFKWKKPIIIVCGVVGVAAAVTSLLVPVYYEASTSFYAASPALQSPAVIFGESSKDLEFYGESEDMDRVMECALSTELIDYMVKEFHLYSHYDIDSTNVKAPYRVRLKFSKRYTVEKNERDAIQLTLTDKDRELTADMANAARDKINDIANGLIRQSQLDIITSYEAQIKEKEETLALLSDSISNVRRRYNIFDAESQRELLGTQLPALKGNIASEQARLAYYQKAGRQDSVRVIKGRIMGYEGKLQALTTGTDGLDVSRGISKIDQLAQIEQTLMEELGEDKAKYKKYKSAFSIPKPALFVQDAAEAPVIKSWPKRTSMVLGSTFVAFFFCILGVLVLEYNRDVDWRKIVKGE